LCPDADDLPGAQQFADIVNGDVAEQASDGDGVVGAEVVAFGWLLFGSLKLAVLLCSLFLLEVASVFSVFLPPLFNFPGFFDTGVHFVLLDETV
jgi:hypothetical protein